MRNTPAPSSLAMPLESLPTTLTFPLAETADEHGRVTGGGDLEPGTLLAAYRSGLFPMRQKSGELTWWSPDPRGVLTLDGLHVSQSLRKSLRRYETRVNTCFEAVIEACADRNADDYLWITTEIQQAYGRLHQLGWAHSVEAWSVPAGGEPAELVGGLYGVAIGGMFFGESMFHRRPNASKVALVALVNLLRGDGQDADKRVIDVQWLTPHLASLGAVAIPRREYLARTERALMLPLPKAFSSKIGYL